MINNVTKDAVNTIDNMTANERLDMVNKEGIILEQDYVLFFIAAHMGSGDQFLQAPVDDFEITDDIQAELSKMVHDAKNAEAREINNSGYQNQIKWLLQNSGDKNQIKKLLPDHIKSSNHANTPTPDM